MKKIIGTLSIMITCSGLISCNKDTGVKSDTPINTAMLMKNAIDSKNYEAFNKLFIEDRKRVITKEDFDKFNKVSTAGTSHKIYTTISFTNGEMFLIKLTTEKINE